MERYLVIATTVSLGALGLPIPVPLAGLLVAGGVFAAHGQLCVFLLTVVVTVGAVLGDVVGYATGRAGILWYRRGGAVQPASLRRSAQVLRKLVGRVLTSRGVMRVRQYAESRLVRGGSMGALIVLSRTLLGAFGPAINVLSGVRHYPLGRFLLYDAVGELIWVAAYVGLGFAAGMHGNDPKALLTNPLMLIVTVAGLAVPLVVTLRVGSRHRPCPALVEGHSLP